MGLEKNISVIILAAGEARRMGQPKQLMQLQGQSLVQRAIRTAQSVSDRIIVVTGAYADEVQRELHTQTLSFAYNPNWATGMGSSIRTGIQKAVWLNPTLEAVIILLCDQPLVTPTLLQQLMQAHRQTGKILVASAYQRTVGVPALFGEALFPDLLALDGKAGAKQVISRYATQVATVAFPEGAHDIDTPEDFERIQQWLRSK